jgi:hypothetical protein
MCAEMFIAARLRERSPDGGVQATIAAQNGLESYLDSRQATQLTTEGLAARFGRDPSLREQLTRAQDELDHGRYPGIIMLQGTSGHEVTAYDIEVQPDGSRKIFTYDSNRPLTDAELVSPTTHAAAETQDSVITIGPGFDHWQFTSQSGRTLSGGGDRRQPLREHAERRPRQPDLARADRPRPGRRHHRVGRRGGCGRRLVRWRAGRARARG